MKNSKYLAIGLLLLALILIFLSGCISKSDYDTLRSQATALIAENVNLQNENQSLRNENDSLQSTNTALQSERSTLNTESESAKIELQALQAEMDALQADYDDVNSELADIKKLFPPGDFSSVNELDQWLAQNDVSGKPITSTFEGWYRRAREVQEDAFDDGYVISIDYDTYDDDSFAVLCVTVINGTIWFWDPETDDIYEGAMID